MIAIIPARGGSKRIPRKNIKDFLGKPVIAYAIETALKSRLFEEVMVSTDDEEIAAVAKKYGATVPFLRSSENSNDFAGTFEVIEEVIGKYSKLGRTFDEICCIYPCTPLLQTEYLVSAYKQLIENGYYSVYPVVAYSTPIQRALTIFNEKLTYIHPEHRFTRSQDLEKAYFDPGQFYWMKVAPVLQQKGVFTDNTGCIVIDELFVQDIDNETDWKLAELKYKLLKAE
ncbi:pseudaminic acid cytidylyltransferase [Fluviicola chungangensis]|uniref:Pseudaminic acid cytidylyltransferase n=1 Tax=Fluviicola chungangensis TaxID=2597671 RepID=A0A556MPW3_9FLAO|nr:pseudaminic acid cytidylyltransferase [Fluviicola chungangensis]TSJ41994.1 pseudaminic acid cytidylyltransferase [Fluviicola chungangensis]